MDLAGRCLMPILVNKRGRLRWMCRVKSKEIVSSKLFPDDSQSEKAAIEWESQERLQIRQPAETPLDFVTVLDWATKYLEHSQGSHCQKVFEKKRAAFSRLLRSSLVSAKDSAGQVGWFPMDKKDPGKGRFPGSGVSAGVSNRTLRRTRQANYLIYLASPRGFEPLSPA